MYVANIVLFMIKLSLKQQSKFCSHLNNSIKIMKKGTTTWKTSFTVDGHLSTSCFLSVIFLRIFYFFFYSRNTARATDAGILGGPNS